VQPFNDMVREPSPGLDFVMMPAASLAAPVSRSEAVPDAGVTPDIGDSRREDRPIDGVTLKRGPQCSPAEWVGEHSFCASRSGVERPGMYQAEIAVVSQDVAYLITSGKSTRSCPNLSPTSTAS
jgi:hypothetical protein